MRNILKERLEDVSGIGKLRSSVRQDLFDPDIFIKDYPVARRPPIKISDFRKIDMAVAPPQTLRHRPSVDLVQAAKTARKDIWRAHTGPSLNKMRSIDSLKSKPAVDLMEAANFVRISRGEQPLQQPLPSPGLAPGSIERPASVERDSSETPRYTNFSTPYTYSQGTPRTTTPPTTPPPGTILNFSRPSSRRGDVKTIRRRSQSFEHQKPLSQFENPRPSTSSSTASFLYPPSAFRRASPPPVLPKNGEDDDTESIAELASKFPLPAKTPPGSIRSPSIRSPSIRSPSGSIRSASIRSPPASIKGHSRKGTRTSINSLTFHATSTPSTPGNDIQVLEVLKSNGDLHERYSTQSEDVDYITTISNPVVHETIIPKVQNITTTEITRHHHTHEVRTHIQPVVDKQFEPEKHYVQTLDGGFVEVTAEAAERLKARYKYVTRVEETVSSVKVPAAPSYTWKPPRDTQSRSRGHTA
ncbi:hypothetical protein H072_720 [Dactylellina haptotyla CBS 200.50]|uniref:Uncharacterized protein n=1 Tax=Dactylellina haptotyla (strain CBS 200.50) TaxID=1284197 RepID=S8AQT7_DACHA|nr:hypothetical protein H072_720 [Dactylellina haptotyla CBS 200.50]